eukprot:290705-Rhodomonas_salina.1
MNADRGWTWVSPKVLWPDGTPLGACAPDNLALEGQNRKPPPVARLRYTQVRRLVIDGSLVGGAVRAD